MDTITQLISTMFSKNIPLCLALLMSAALFTNCKKDNNTDSDTPTSDYYFSAKLDGQSILHEIDQSGNNEMANSIDASIGPPDCTYSYGCAIGPNIADEPYFEVYFPDLFVGDCADVNAAFSGLFAPGPFSFGTSSGKVLIRYWDGNELWASYPLGQANAFFNVTKSDRTDTPFGVYQRVVGEANCLLFNDAGQQKKLENVKFALSFSKD